MARKRELFQDLMVYKAKIDAARRKTLDELANKTKELDMGYLWLNLSSFTIRSSHSSQRSHVKVKKQRTKANICYFGKAFFAQTCPNI